MYVLYYERMPVRSHESSNIKQAVTSRPTKDLLLLDIYEC